MLTIHHLNNSQSERILWLCEELAIPYTLIPHTRQPTFAAPSSLQQLPGNLVGTAPFIEDNIITNDEDGSSSSKTVTLSESGAIVEYIIQRYGDGRLALGATHARYADYLFWLHYSNSTLQCIKTQCMIIGLSQTPAGTVTPAGKMVASRVTKAFTLLEEHLRDNTYLAGEEFTAADIMMGYTLGTGRLYTPISYEAYPSIVRYLATIGGREGYKRAMRKAGQEEDVEVLLSARGPERSVLGF